MLVPYCSPKRRHRARRSLWCYAVTRSSSVPYRNRELTISASDSVRLSATLTLPEGRGPFPAVALISGSGPQDRIATIFLHEPFALIADYLARTGIATTSAALTAHPVVTPPQP